MNATRKRASSHLSLILSSSFLTTIATLHHLCFSSFLNTPPFLPSRRNPNSHPIIDSLNFCGVSLPVMAHLHTSRYEAPFVPPPLLANLLEIYTSRSSMKSGPLLSTRSSRRIEFSLPSTRVRRMKHASTIGMAPSSRVS